eukprot:SAG11_NODE_39004_length_243_cov_30.381944_1_plen_38_part_10
MGPMVGANDGLSRGGVALLGGSVARGDGRATKETGAAR